ncbi:SLATT domain-containing protein [Chryseobacterium binzhouense]|uniref:SLATT domain-containing protein n=1 Tax=Chryseobacterium binzhouense TaxID=2593646 RepID=UPI00117DF38A|nr:SLATT domain-containing protein [Chryseobacterium binzhouense]
MEGKTYKDYLDKTFLEELNYKLWSTKGIRFGASTRLTQTANLSNLSINLLSVYLTAVGLLGVYNLHFNQLNEDLIAYSITSLSILALVFGQIENAKDFSVKSKEFHDCGLELSEVYNELRIYKTLTENQTIKDKEIFAKKISDQYQNILERYENHLKIDNELFKTKTAKYHLLSNYDVFKIKIEYYFRTKFVYHFLIVFPPIIIIILLLNVN